MFWAIDKNDAEISQLLLNAGIDINHKDKEGLKALQLSLLNGQSNIADKILFTCRNMVGEGNNLTICNVDEPIKKLGLSPLMIAVKKNDLDLVDVLLKLGANPQAPVKKDDQIITALALAYGKPGIKKVFEQRLHEMFDNTLKYFRALRANDNIEANEALLAGIDIYTKLTVKRRRCLML